MKKRIATYPLVISFLVIFAASCATQKKLKSIRKGEVTEIQLTLGNEVSNIPELKEINVTRDTLKIKDDEGKDILIMKAIKDEETGEMVATDVIDAATVTARFRNVAERSGKVDLNFQVIVPQSMMDGKWQLRFYPDLLIQTELPLPCARVHGKKAAQCYCKK